MCDVNKSHDYVGRFSPSRSVEIRPRANGEVASANRDRDVARKGQLLFTINARPYASQFGEARANVGSAASALTLSKCGLSHATGLARQREGTIDFLTVLDAQRTFADADADLATADVRIADAQVDLFRSLGGGWAAPSVATTGAGDHAGR